DQPQDSQEETDQASDDRVAALVAPDVRGDKGQPDFDDEREEEQSGHGDSDCPRSPGTGQGAGATLTSRGGSGRGARPGPPPWSTAHRPGQPTPGGPR